MSEPIIKGRAAMASILGVTIPGLVRMEERGLPVALKDHFGNHYALAKVLPWVLADQSRKLVKANARADKDQLFTRRAEAETRKAEIEVGKLESTLGDIALIRRGLEGVIINQRTVLLSLPAQIGREIDEPEFRRRVVAIVERVVREALEALSNYDPIIAPLGDASGTSESDDSGDVAPGQAAAEVNREPVGRAKTIPQPRRRRVRAVAK